MPQFVIHVPSSHLYRGLRLCTVPAAHAKSSARQAQKDADVILLFEDGSRTTAELMHDEGGHVALYVAAYRTARGTSIAAKMWTAKGIEERDGGLDIRLGYRFPDLPK